MLSETKFANTDFPDWQKAGVKDTRRNLRCQSHNEEKSTVFIQAPVKAPVHAGLPPLPPASRDPPQPPQPHPLYGNAASTPQRPPQRLRPSGAGAGLGEGGQGAGAEVNKYGLGDGRWRRREAGRPAGGASRGPGARSPRGAPPAAPSPSAWRGRAAPPARPLPSNAAAPPARRSGNGGKARCDWPCRRHVPGGGARAGLATARPSWGGVPAGRRGAPQCRGGARSAPAPLGRAARGSCCPSSPHTQQGPWRGRWTRPLRYLRGGCVPGRSWRSWRCGRGGLGPCAHPGLPHAARSGVCSACTALNPNQCALRGPPAFVSVGRSWQWILLPALFWGRGVPLAFLSSGKQESG